MPKKTGLNACGGGLLCQAAGKGETIIHSNCARQTPGHLSFLDLGKAQNTGPTKSAPLRTT